MEEEDISNRVSAESVVRAYAGVSKKGYAPYNPRKRNQDAIVIEEVIGPVGPTPASTIDSMSLEGARAQPTGAPGLTTTSGSITGTGRTPSDGLTREHASRSGFSPTGASSIRTASGYAKTHVFGVFDGHGEQGDLVSHHFASRLPGMLAAHPKWGFDLGAAMVEQLDVLERQLLAGA